MPIGAVTEHINVALIALYLFWAFFAGLVYWLRREDQREGYLLEKANERGDPLEILVPAVPAQKPYYLHDGTVAMKPDGIADTRELKLRHVEDWEGAPAEPTGNPMLDGVGPASYAMRRDEPEIDHSGNPKIAPMRVLADFSIAKEDTDPRGLPVYARDGAVGTLKEAWVDRAEALIRYYEVALDDQSKSVLVPAVFVDVNTWQGKAKVKIVTKAEFALVPTTKHPDIVTKLEEDKISAYYAGADVYGGARAQPAMAS
ncbi:MAG: photosynthetic reaction center subunit H [Geminicoccaceae bacterium]|nr:MAG: photosynthetic reaction center subunit H [Geminicoccaceae bacterium]